MKKRIGAALAAAALALTQAGILPTTVQAAGVPTVEYLNRGISAINTGKGMLVSWRDTASDPEGTVYRLYRGNELIYTAEAGKATCFLDAGGNASAAYKVESVVGGKVTSSEVCSLISNNAYFDVPLSPPGSGYTPNDCSVGDVDGDGEYEIFLKWDPPVSKDNSQKGVTGNVFIDCLKLDGTRLWRIDLGINIRAGAHYTQFYVADFDLDGCAEMTCKTSDGTKDGTGKVIGDASASYRNSNGYILTGNEFYTLFDGQTGAALDTVNYKPGRGTVSKWGDNYGNRVDRFWGTVAYLDGVHPCVVTGRGYYTRMTATAYKVENKKLVELWAYDTGNSNSSTNSYGDGNHNSMPADVDGDGRQEIITGAAIIDDNGKLFYTTKQGHGDAMHVADLDPTNPGQEIWICHEEEKTSGWGVSLIDPDQKKILYHQNGKDDTGRCCADNIWAGNPGAECWGNKTTDDKTPVVDTKGNTLDCRRPSINFLTYWDGDLERELLDGGTDKPATISKVTGDAGKTTITNLLVTDGYYTCNTTKATPCLSADIFGDWREELIVRAADAKSMRIFCTPYATDYRITTLMHDPQYRMQVSSQNTAYNQPPHASFFLGTGYALPGKPEVEVNGKGMVMPEPISAFETIEAEAFDSSENVRVEDLASGGKNIGFITNGSSIMYQYVDFEDGANAFIANISGGAAKIEVYADTMTGTPAATLTFNGNGNFNDYQKVEWNIPTISGQHRLYLKFTGGEGYLLNLDSFWFGKDNVPLNGLLIQNVQVLDKARLSGWRLNPVTAATAYLFGDRDFTAPMPEALVGAEQLLTACDSKKNLTEDIGQFTAGEDITVYVGVDTRVDPLPAFLANAKKTELSFVSSNDVTFEVYAMDYQKGDTVTLGTNGQEVLCVNYTVFVKQREKAVETTTQTEETTTQTEETTTLTEESTTQTEETSAQTEESTTQTIETTTQTEEITTPTKESTTQAAQTTTTEPVSAEQPFYGDVNLDGSIDITDAVLLAKANANAVTLNPQARINADCKKDDEIGSSDTIVLMRFLVGAIKVLPQ